jgi:hypothetical protein
MSERLEQVSVPLPAPLIAFVRQRAGEEQRSVAQVVRMIVAAEAARQQVGGERAA